MCTAGSPRRRRTPVLPDMYLLLSRRSRFSISPRMGRGKLRKLFSLVPQGCLSCMRAFHLLPLDSNLVAQSLTLSLLRQQPLLCLVFNSSRLGHLECELVYRLGFPSLFLFQRCKPTVGVGATADSLALALLLLWHSLLLLLLGEVDRAPPLSQCLLYIRELSLEVRHGTDCV